MKTELTDKIAVVTGAGQGIGKSVALTLSQYGAKVIVSDINIEKAEEVSNQISSLGGIAKAIKADVSVEDEVKGLFRKIIKSFNTVDILVNNAGIYRSTPIVNIGAAEWDMVLSVNLKSAFMCSKEAFIIMKPKKYGKIISIASAAAKIGGVLAGAHYCASKAGIIALTKSLALQAAPYNINVNAVCPGPVNTAITLSWGKKVNEDFIARIPFKRYAEPEDIAEAVAFLSSDRAKYITGEILDVNGGLIMD